MKSAVSIWLASASSATGSLDEMSDISTALIAVPVENAAIFL